MKFNKPDDNDKATVVFTPVAWAKMEALVRGFRTEVGFHFLTKRSGRSTFEINDVLLFPQVVTSATFDAPDDEYLQWLMSLDDEVLNHMKGHGHSHVRMGVCPSYTDMNYRKEIVANEQDYYLFVIVNKFGDLHFQVFDAKYGIMYGDNDVCFDIADDSFSASEFVTEAFANVIEQKSETKGA